MYTEQEKENLKRIFFLEEKEKEIQQQKEAEHITDYDEALKEWREKEENRPHRIRFKGEIFEIPSSIPFQFSLFYLRNCIKKENGKTIFFIPEDKQADFIEKMFGSRFLSLLQQAEEVELSFVFSVLVPDIMEKWGYGITQGAGESKNR